MFLEILYYVGKMRGRIVTCVCMARKPTSIGYSCPVLARCGCTCPCRCMGCLLVCLSRMQLQNTKLRLFWLVNIFSSLKIFFIVISCTFLYCPNFQKTCLVHEYVLPQKTNPTSLCHSCSKKQKLSGITMIHEKPKDAESNSLFASLTIF